MKLIHALGEALIFRITHLGQIPLCGGERHHATVICGMCLPICNRCLAAITAIFSMPHIPIWKDVLSHQSMLIIGSLAITPCFIDGVAQYHLMKESNNSRRIVTGLLMGIGLSLIKHAIR